MFHLVVTHCALHVRRINVLSLHPYTAHNVTTRTWCLHLRLVRVPVLAHVPLCAHTLCVCPHYALAMYLPCHVSTLSTVASGSHHTRHHASHTVAHFTHDTICAPALISSSYIYTRTSEQSSSCMCTLAPVSYPPASSSSDGALEGCAWLDTTHGVPTRTYYNLARTHGVISYAPHHRTRT